LPTRLAESGRVEQVRGSLDRPERYAGGLDGSTAILHLAARVGRAKPAQFRHDNVEGTRTLVRAAEQQGVAGIVNVSSIAAKFPETAYYPYAESKRAAEAIVAKGRRPWITIRPTIVLGPGSPIWAKFRQLARGPLPVVPGSPSTRIQPIHVDDLAAILLDLAETGSFDGTVCELGGAEPVTIEEFLKRVHERLSGRRGVTIPVPIALGMPLLRALERISPVPLPVTEGQLSTFLYDGVVDPNPVQERYRDRLRGVDDILDALIDRQAG
ncbi:MAG: NAD-dependent epimerase/dehydratase family protein, partial [Gemmatimonadota bacterium]